LSDLGFGGFVSRTSSLSFTLTPSPIALAASCNRDCKLSAQKGWERRARWGVVSQSSEVTDWHLAYRDTRALFTHTHTTHTHTHTQHTRTSPIHSPASPRPMPPECPPTRRGGGAVSFEITPDHTRSRPTFGATRHQRGGNDGNSVVVEACAAGRRSRRIPPRRQSGMHSSQQRLRSAE